jgi:hypothetical protein
MESWAKETALQTRTNGTRCDVGRGGQVGDKPKQRQRQERPGANAKRGYNNVKKASLTRAITAELCVAYAGVGRHSGHAMRRLQLMLCGSH